MPSLAVVEQLPLAVVHIHHPSVFLDGAAFVGSIDDGMLFRVETNEIHYDPWA